MPNKYRFLFYSNKDKNYSIILFRNTTTILESSSKKKKTILESVIISYFMTMLFKNNEKYSEFDGFLLMLRNNPVMEAPSVLQTEV